MCQISLSIHWQNWPLGGSHIFTIVNKAPIDTNVQVSLWCARSYRGFILGETSTLTSTMAVLIYILTLVFKVFKSSFSTFPPALFFLSFFFFPLETGSYNLAFAGLELWIHSDLPASAIHKLWNVIFYFESYDLLWVDFCTGWEIYSFILPHVEIQVSTHNLLKRFFLQCVYLRSLSKIRWLWQRGLISGSYSLFHLPVYLVWHSIILFCYQSSVI